MKKKLENAYLALILVFLYIPIITLIALSFNEGKSRAKWQGFSLKWYADLFENETILLALRNTLIIALVSAIVATLIGTLAAIALEKYGKRSRALINALTNIPLLNADIVTGISLMLCFIAFGVSLGFGTILLSHITFNIPYVILSVSPKLKQTSKSAYEAALDLGADSFTAFIKVVLPDIMPGISSGFLLAFTMSLDDFIITHFTKGAGINTISTLVYSEVRLGIRPSMYALSTIIFLAVLIILIAGNYAPKAIAGRKLENEKRRLGMS